jgi:8-oxo-dGTP diphosphatase
MLKTVHVVVAVIENDCGEVLIAKRPDHLHLGGLWEFPGGKVEIGESVIAALRREIREEIDLDIHSAEPLLKIPFSYPEKNVLLDVWRVTHFSGVPRGCEAQQIQWVRQSQLADFTFPSANRHILTALALSERMLITGNFHSREECLEKILRAITQHKIGLVQLRAHHLSGADYRSLAAEALKLCRQHQVRLLLNTDADHFLSTADGLHLTAARLQACELRPVADTVLLGASCHSSQEIRKAITLGVDYICVSPVLPTGSHPEHAALGWSGFSELIEHCPIPVFALGGMDEYHLQQVKTAGALGIAGISAWW